VTRRTEISVKKARSSEKARYDLAFCFLFSGNGQDDLAHVLALVEKIVRRLGLLNRQNGVDGGLHKACLDLGINVTDDAAQNICLHGGMAGAKGASDDPHVADVNILQINLNYIN
jgi:hypothetical protein